MPHDVQNQCCIISVPVYNTIFQNQYHSHARFLTFSAVLLDKEAARSRLGQWFDVISSVLPHPSTACCLYRLHLVFCRTSEPEFIKKGPLFLPRAPWAVLYIRMKLGSSFKFKLIVELNKRGWISLQNPVFEICCLWVECNMPFALSSIIVLLRLFSKDQLPHS